MKLLTGFFSFVLIVFAFGSFANAEELKKIDWKCSDFDWKKEPYFEGEIEIGDRGEKAPLLHGIFEVNCRFKGLHGGDYARLDEFVHKFTKEESIKVFDGPNRSKRKNLPAAQYDVEYPLEDIFFRQEDDGSIRIEQWTMTDRESIAKIDASLKSVDTKTLFQYLEKATVQAEVAPGKEASWFQTKFHAKFTLRKPKYIPKFVFPKQMQITFELAAPQVEKEVLTYIGNHL